jgi:hypothetical protein
MQVFVDPLVGSNAVGFDLCHPLSRVGEPLLSGGYVHRLRRLQAAEAPCDVVRLEVGDQTEERVPEAARIGSSACHFALLEPPTGHQVKDCAAAQDGVHRLGQGGAWK